MLGRDPIGIEAGPSLGHVVVTKIACHEVGHHMVGKNEFPERA